MRRRVGLLELRESDLILSNEDFSPVFGRWPDEVAPDPEAPLALNAPPNFDSALRLATSWRGVIGFPAASRGEPS